MVNEEEMGSNAGRHHSTDNKRLVAPSPKSHVLWHMASMELLMGIQLARLSQAWEVVPLPLLCEQQCDKPPLKAEQGNSFSLGE